MVGDVATLYLDGTESSALHLSEPSYLEFEYMQHVRAIIDAQFDKGSPVRALHLGGAGCALARALDADRPNSRQLAVEIDAVLARKVREWFDLPPAPRLRIRIDDARRTLDTTKATWDIIIRDAFIERKVPTSLLTLEAAQHASAVLADGGVYILNSIASTGLVLLGEEIAALEECFTHIIAIIDPAILKGRRFGNIVIAASHLPFDTAAIERSVRKLPLPATLTSHAQMSKWARKPLTDDQITSK